MKPKKSLGQNFLKDENILFDIAEEGKINNEDIVIEIGPGTGNLTKEILNRNPKKLIVIEKDKQLSDMIEKKFGKSLHVINNDFLNCYNDINFENPVKVFGNLPYNIATKILISLIKFNNISKVFRKFVFVFQKEVADRIIAEKDDHNYGRLSILSSWKLEKKKIFDISPKKFYPIPKVWSSLVVLKPKLKCEKINEIKNLEHITNIFFNQRRKMIKKPMRQLFIDYEKKSKELKLDLNLRPQNLSVEKYLEICQLYEELS